MHTVSKISAVQCVCVCVCVCIRWRKVKVAATGKMEGPEREREGTSEQVMRSNC